LCFCFCLLYIFIDISSLEIDGKIDGGVNGVDVGALEGLCVSGMKVVKMDGDIDVVDTGALVLPNFCSFIFSTCQP